MRYSTVLPAARKTSLVEEALAASGATQAGNTVVTIPFALELVVVGEFFVCGLSALVNCAVEATYFARCPEGHK
jgi:hypothetical protein